MAQNFLSKINAAYRFPDWVYLLGLTVLGFVFAHNTPPWFPHLPASLLISALYLCYGYAFNQVCDKKTQTWKFSDFLLFAIPLAACMLLASLNYPLLTLPLVIAVVCNTVYSFPSICWKKTPVASVLINAYLFGCLFVIGACAGHPALIQETALMSLYMACFFVPAQLLHELAHAQKDNRLVFIEKNSARYLTGITISIGAMCFFSFYLWESLSLNWLFLCGNLLWIVFLARAYKIKIRQSFSIAKARSLREFFKSVGFLFGLCFFLAFLFE